MAQRMSLGSRGYSRRRTHHYNRRHHFAPPRQADRSHTGWNLHACLYSVFRYHSARSIFPSIPLQA